MNSPTAKPDWYDDPDSPDRYRYWNGQEWTEDYAPKATVAATAKAPQRGGSAWPRGFTLGGKAAVAFFAAAGMLTLIGVLGSGGSNSEKPASAPASSAASNAPSTAPSASTSESTAPKPTKTYKPKPINYKSLSDRDWKLLAKNPDRFSGDHYVVYANVTQFDAATGDDTFRADAAGRDMRSYGFWDGSDNTLFTGGTRQLRNVVEGDVVRAKVTVVGSFSYETQIGGETTVPLLSVDKIEVIGSTD